MMTKTQLLSFGFIYMVYHFSNKFGKDLWNAKIICNKI